MQMKDELDARKKRVLQAIVDDYIESAEPVGSRTLARKYDLGVSPATIRNEMADLEISRAAAYLFRTHPIVEGISLLRGRPDPSEARER